jgi:hypothetical protein
MKGIVFNLLESVITREHGLATWDALLEQSKLDGAWTSLGTYADEHLYKLVGAASTALSLPAAEVVRWFGVQALGLFVERYPQFFKPHATTRGLLLTLNNIIHPEVRKLYPNADVPEFQFDTSSDEVLLIGYRSHRKLCAFAIGLIEGAAAHYGERATIEHRTCMHHGDAQCLLAVRTTKIAA